MRGLVKAAILAATSCAAICSSAHADVVFGTHLKWFAPNCSDGVASNGIEFQSNQVGCLSGPALPPGSPMPNVYLSGATMPADQSTTLGQGWNVSFVFPTSTYVLLLDFDGIVDNHISGLLSKVENQFQVSPGTTQTVPFPVLQAHGIDAPGQYEIWALLTDTSLTYGGTDAYGAQAGRFILTVNAPAVNDAPEPASLALVGIALLALGTTRRKRT